MLSILCSTRESKSNSIHYTVIAAATLATVLILTILGQSVMASQQMEKSDGSSSPSNSSSLTDIFKKTENATVQITSTRPNPNELIIINGNPTTGNSVALGSGFVFDKKGHIITNNHVVADATKVDVTFIDGNTYSAKVIGKDPYADLVLLELTDNFSDEKIVPLPIGNSSSIQVGQQVIAIGNPFGFSGSITTGIVSQIARLLPNPDTGFSIPNTIQTDAAINPGNSGGPLLNMQGQVIGMNAAIFSSTGVYSGVGFAIPSNTITREIPALIHNGTYDHPLLGFSGGKITPTLAKSAGLPRNYHGVLVATVQSSSPADKAGLKGMTQDDKGVTHVGDIIISIEGNPVRQIDDIINYIETQKSVGDTVKLKVNRNATILDLTARVTPRAAPAPSQQQQSPQFGIPQLPQIPGQPQLPFIP